MALVPDDVDAIDRVVYVFAGLGRVASRQSLSVGSGIFRLVLAHSAMVWMTGRGRPAVSHSSTDGLPQNALTRLRARMPPIADAGRSLGDRSALVHVAAVPDLYDLDQ